MSQSHQTALSSKTDLEAFCVCSFLSFRSAHVLRDPRLYFKKGHLDPGALVGNYIAAGLLLVLPFVRKEKKKPVRKIVTDTATLITQQIRYASCHVMCTRDKRKEKKERKRKELECPSFFFCLICSVSLKYISMCTFHWHSHFWKRT